MYIEVTHDIRVAVKPVYVEHESDVMNARFVFAYYITIENLGIDRVQLLRRQWFIQDSSGESYEVHGDGVVGQKPILEPGQSHQYSSFCILKSFKGSMEGNYEMVKDDGTLIKVLIPKFQLRSHLLN